MLSDKEKEAIEIIKYFKKMKWYSHPFDNGTEILSEEEKQYIDIILNLIEKQQKDIESWKKYCDEQENDITLKNNKICDLEFKIEKQSKEIEELKAVSEYREKIIKGLGLKTLPKTITGFRKLIENNDKKWENKIKAKIEELEKQDKESKLSHNYLVIPVLQSLLGKE